MCVLLQWARSRVYNYAYIWRVLELKEQNSLSIQPNVVLCMRIRAPDVRALTMGEMVGMYDYGRMWRVTERPHSRTQNPLMRSTIKPNVSPLSAHRELLMGVLFQRARIGVRDYESMSVAFKDRT